MGGFGSGRYPYASTATVEECRQLDVDEFADAVNHPGTSAIVRWGDRDDPDATIQATLLAALPTDDGEHSRHETKAMEESTTPERAAGVRLSYTVSNTRTGEQREREYTIPFEYTECNFGGVRPWFRCRGVVDGRPCDDRVGKLYLPPGEDLFLCRECYDLGYRSSRTSGDDVKQAELRYRRAFAKADAEDRRAHPASEPWLPERPKGMHHDTFRELLEDVHTASEEWHDAMQARTRERAKRLSDRYDAAPTTALGE